MSKEKIKVAPEVCSFVDDEHKNLTLEVALPGVSKKDIKLKMHEDSFTLSAPRGEHEFVTSLAFCCPVRPGKAAAKYENGLLRIKIPFKDPMDDAINIEVK